MENFLAPVDVIDHNYSRSGVVRSDEHAMTCAVCRQFSQLPQVIRPVSVVQFLTSNVNR